MSNLIIFYNLLNIWLLFLIDLDILTTILPKTDVPYPWIWLLYLVSINSACITDHLCIPAIILPLYTKDRCSIPMTEVPYPYPVYCLYKPKTCSIPMTDVPYPYLRYLHQFHFIERCLSGSDWSSQFLRQFQLWYAKPGLSCRPTCRIGCRISNTRVFKLPDFVHWGSYYWRQPGRQAGGQQSLRQLLSSGLELCPLALLQLLSYRAQLWVLGTPYGFNTNW